ncbi:MAG: aspartate ammonia-lyase [Candidatus Caldatribacterium sp.]|uniref:aspartate ammonia-lyase n=1 Tax=Candidatus Caldatribacterium sp. TaxID=2282143 RepID=UPI002993A7FB|nr:aspartate ammonia-lyase [Candidatus Caldatribacterium sp.]MCX7729670.1 aspartate ammonia-lyase [Candidatus Caldatribacterium sp.]MDW8081688.1 aspartate ammonia-lyase [Candidatus Calescibacterium sp.]
MRRERDFLGELDVPEDRYFGIHAARARENFPLPVPVPSSLIRAFFAVKWACAAANRDIGLLEEPIASAILRACEEGMEGKWNDEIIVPLFQGGAGTSLNMNVNEVIANRALEILGYDKGRYDVVNPFDTVNLSQSTNDVFPTALRVAALWELADLEMAIVKLQDALQKKEKEFASVLKVGRTELQDAVPVTLGMEFGAWAEAIGRDRWRLWKVKERLKEVNLGGTAVGTGLNAHPRYIARAIAYLNEVTRLPVAKAMNTFENTQNLDVFAEVSGLLRALAVNLRKMTNDLRLLAMGPRAGIGEILLPPLQEGSSIMPGKVNPVLCEYVEGIALDVFGKDLALSFAASSGQLELNHLLPFVAYFLLTMIEELRIACTVLAERYIPSIQADTTRCRELLEKSFAFATCLVPYLGHEVTSELVKECLKTGKDLREVLLEKGLFTQEELEIILDPTELSKPGIPGLGKIRKGDAGNTS